MHTKFASSLSHPLIFKFWILFLSFVYHQTFLSLHCWCLRLSGHCFHFLTLLYSSTPHYSAFTFLSFCLASFFFFFLLNSFGWTFLKRISKVLRRHFALIMDLGGGGYEDGERGWLIELINQNWSLGSYATTALPCPIILPFHGWIDDEVNAYLPSFKLDDKMRCELFFRKCENSNDGCHLSTGSLTARLSRLIVCCFVATIPTRRWRTIASSKCCTVSPLTANCLLCCFRHHFSSLSAKSWLIRVQNPIQPSK